VTASTLEMPPAVALAVFLEFSAMPSHALEQGVQKLHQNPFP
jgi:hypothetical protein